ncbi:hypothetical protein BLA29_008363, partial [Euroglyphus maynei]
GNGRDGQLGLLKQQQTQAEFEIQPILINDYDDEEDVDDIDDPRDHHQQNNRFIDIACGSFHSLALDYDGNVWGWGQNSNGQLFVQTNMTNMDDDLTVTLSHNDNDSMRSSKHISINLNSSSTSTSSNQMILTSGSSPKHHNRWKPSILFSIAEIIESQQQQQQQNDDDFTDWQIPFVDGDGDDCRNPMDRLQRKILLTILYYRHDLNLKSLIRR